MTPLPIQKFNPWPYAIIGYFIVFVLCIAGFITWAVRQDMDLVRPDYYDQEMRYQQQIDRQNRTAALSRRGCIIYDAAKQLVTVHLPSARAPQATAGRIHFYRPSNAALDHELPLALDADGRQRIAAEKLQGGLWKIRVHWTAEGGEFFLDQPVVLAPAGS